MTSIEDSAAGAAAGAGAPEGRSPEAAEARAQEGAAPSEGGAAPATVTLYTAQAQVVMDTLERDGVYRVKNAYVDQKYGDEVAWIWRQAYSFFSQNAGRYVPKPEGAESGIWTFYDEKWTGAQPGYWMLKLEVPADHVVSFDLRAWNRIQNLDYLPKDEADGRRFQQNLERQGIKQAMQAFSTPFYPLVKREIEASWQRLFTSAEGCPETYLEAGLWEIRREWVADAKLC